MGTGGRWSQRRNVREHREGRKGGKGKKPQVSFPCSNYTTNFKYVWLALIGNASEGDVQMHSGRQAGQSLMTAGASE
jgi:hypothetical protein